MSDGDVLPETTPDVHTNTPAEDAADETKLRLAIAASVAITVGSIVAGERIGASKGHKVVGALIGVPVAYVLSKVSTALIAPNYAATWARLNDPTVKHSSDDPGNDTGDLPVKDRTLVPVTPALLARLSTFITDPHARNAALGLQDDTGSDIPLHMAAASDTEAWNLMRGPMAADARNAVSPDTIDDAHPTGRASGSGFSVERMN